MLVDGLTRLVMYRRGRSCGGDSFKNSGERVEILEAASWPAEVEARPSVGGRAVILSR